MFPQQVEALVKDPVPSPAPPAPATVAPAAATPMPAAPARANGSQVAGKHLVLTINGERHEAIVETLD
jgi:hypothetical protein